MNLYKHSRKKDRLSRVIPDSRGAHAAPGASPGGADWQLPSAQWEDADDVLQVHPEGAGGRRL